MAQTFRLCFAETDPEPTTAESRSARRFSSSRRFVRLNVLPVKSASLLPFQLRDDGADDVANSDDVTDGYT